MSGDERNRPAAEQPPIVQRGRNDPRSAPPWGAAPPPRADGVPPHGEGPSSPLGGSGGGRIESYSGGAPADRFVEDARFGELYVLFIKNLLLGIVTLGIYRFWGKTRIRKYVWSHVSFRNERFEYAGTGRELFLGFLVALAILGPPFFGFTLWIQFDPPTSSTPPEKLLILYAVLFVLIFVSFYFNHVAIFSAYRYRITRTLWHGIRGSVEGNAWNYGWRGFGFAMLNSLTLGWTQPWAHTSLINFRMANTRIGTVPVEGQMDTKGLWVPFAVAWVISTIVGVIVIAILVAIFVSKYQRGVVPDPNDTELTIIAVLAYLAVPVTWLVTVNWYRAALLRKVAGTFSAGGLKFSFPVRGGTLLWFTLSNTFILLFTLGLLYPYVILRYARFVQRHLAITGTIDYAAWQQSEGWRPSTGEGMAEFFGVGII